MNIERVINKANCRARSFSLFSPPRPRRIIAKLHVSVRLRAIRFVKIFCARFARSNGAAADLYARLNERRPFFFFFYFILFSSFPRTRVKMSFERNRDEPLSLSLSRYSTFAIAWKDRFRPMIFKRQKEAARNVKTYVNDVVNGIASPLLSTLVTKGLRVYLSSSCFNVKLLLRPLLLLLLLLRYSGYFFFTSADGRSTAIVKVFRANNEFWPPFYVYIGENIYRR